MHRHDVALIAVTVRLVAVGFAALMAVIGTHLRRRAFAGPLRDQWDKIRGEVGIRQQFRVQWATSRRRPIGGDNLIPAQRAYLAYALDTSQRSPLSRRPWLWIPYSLVMATLGVMNLILGLHGEPVPNFLAAAGFGLFTLMYLTMPWTQKRGKRQLIRLRDQLADVS